MNKAYDKVTWVNKPSTASPINQTNLNKMSDALDIIDDRVIALDSGKVSSVTVTNTLATGDTIATITVDGTATNIKSAQITVDSEISTTSTNPVQNKVIAEALREVMPEVTVEGNPISITDGSNIVPAKLAEVTFLPKQDLHGYNNPWVGGAGKNKCPILAPQTSADIVVTNGSDGSVIFNGTASTTTEFFINLPTLAQGNYAVSANNTVTISSTNTYIECLDSNNTRLGVKAFDTTNVSFTVNNVVPAKIKIRIANGIQVTNFTLKIQLESGSTATSFAPYSNECPISGWTELNLNRCGKNIVNEIHHGNINSNGTYGTGNTRATNATSATSSVIKVKAGKYTISAVGLDYATILTKDNYNNIVDNFAGSWHALPYTFTITQTANLYFTARKSDNTSITLSDVSVQIEEGETATTYEAYQGQTYTESLGSTYYGGKVDFVSGMATIDRVITDLGNYTYSYQSQNTQFFTTTQLDGAPTDNNWADNVICSKYVVNSSGYGTMPTPHIRGVLGGRVYFIDDNYTDSSQVKTLLTGTQLIYPLATPITLTLTPTQIDLLKGNNVLTTDGNSIKLVYSADIKAWVESQLSNS